MAEFNVDDKFDPSKGYDSIRFGSDSVLLETELNELQKIQNHARAEIYRAMAHSGVLELSTGVGIRWSNSSDVINVEGKGKITVPPHASYGGATESVILTAFESLINGHKVKISKALVNNPSTGVGSGDVNVIRLSEPPSEGTRDDLIFLEAWFEEVDSIKDPAIKDARIGEETSRRTKLNWRIRTVAGVDFGKYPYDGFVATRDGYINLGTYINKTIKPQGGNSEVVNVSETDISVNQLNHFQAVNQRKSSWGNGVAKDDEGLYVAGAGNQASKDLLKTADGYVYAIPLFRVKRRNSGGYSQNNGNGAVNFYRIVAVNTTQTIEPGETKTIDFVKADMVKVGDKIGQTSNSSAYPAEVLAVDGNKITLKNLGSSRVTYVSYDKVAERPDGKFANIIHQDDIIDLRHKVSLTGVNYDQLLEENFDKLLRGELRTKEGQKMLKTYHGVPKTPIDNNHVFYTSFDGSTLAEKGNSFSIGATNYVAMPTGLGVSTAYLGTVGQFTAPVADISREGTMEAWVGRDTLKGSNTPIIALYTNGGAIALSIQVNNSNNLYVQERDKDGVLTQIVSSISFMESIKGKYIHVRFTWDASSLYLYINGILFSEKARPTPDLRSKADLIMLNKNSLLFYEISDIAVSNVNRGTHFATLPKDFIDGYAVIDKAFNGQRRNLSDAQTSQYTTSIAKPKSQVSDRGITVEKGTGVNETIFEPGDKIKVKGIAGEIITGVLDADTAIARVTEWVSDSSFKVGNASALVVGDIIKVYSSDLKILASTLTITAINGTTISFTGAVHSNSVVGYYLFESTPSSSSPIVKFGDGETVKTVAGTWTNLGTNEATFTLGENVNLDTEDVFIEYSLNSPNGQGGIPEVLTEVLEGQYLGQKYVKGTPSLRADFRGKVTGSEVENPHMFRTLGGASELGTAIQNPDKFTTAPTQGHFNSVYEPGGAPSVISRSAVGVMAQAMFSFNLVAEVERQIGRIPKSTKAEKIQWIKDNVNKINLNWSGFGSSVGGNKASIRTFRTSDSLWVGSNVVTTSTVTMSTMSFIGANNIGNVMDANGIVQLLVYAEPSDGVTPSVITTDYVDFSIEFNVPTGYDTLTPAEPFHNGTQKNFFFIRKETKEIETFVNCDEDFGVVTWGNYVPYQGTGENVSMGLVVSDNVFALGGGTGKYRANSGTGVLAPFLQNLPLQDKALMYTHSLSNFRGFLYVASNASVTDFNEVTNGVLLNNKLRHSTSGSNYFRLNNPINNEVTVYLVTDPNEAKSKVSDSKFILCAYALFEKQGELYLQVITKPYNTTHGNALDGRPLSVSSTGSTLDTYKLQGRPLVKGV